MVLPREMTETERAGQALYNLTFRMEEVIRAVEDARRFLEAGDDDKVARLLEGVATNLDESERIATDVSDDAYWRDAKKKEVE